MTTVPRTLVDLAAVLNDEALARACHQASVLYRTTPAQVDAVLRPNAPGAATLRRILHGDFHLTLSKLESRFLKLLREAGLPLPITNRPAGGRYVDCRWPEHKLTVELDSYRFHSSRFSWEQDRRREREAYARGDQHRRYVWGDVYEETERDDGRAARAPHSAGRAVDGPWVWARQNARTASLNCSGRSRLLTWPHSGIRTSSVSGIASSSWRATPSGERASSSPHTSRVGTAIRGAGRAGRPRP